MPAKSYLFCGFFFVWGAFWAVEAAYRGDAFDALWFACSAGLCAIFAVCIWFMRNTRPL